MSRAYEDQRNALVRRYLLKALAPMGLSGTEWSVVALIMEDTYGWKRDDQPNWSVRKDRNWFDYGEMAEASESSFSAVSRAMNTLVAMNIVIQYEKPRKGKNGLFGINSEPETWLKKSEIGRRKRLQKSTEISRRKRLQKKAKTPTKDRAIPHGDRAGGPLNRSINSNPPIVPHLGDVTTFQKPSYENVIKEPREAAQIDNLEFTKAVISAEVAYSSRYARPLTRAERADLQVFLATEEHTGSMLAIWLGAIPRADADRKRRKADPEQRQYVRKRPFQDCLDMASEIYQVVKEKKDRSPVKRRETA